MKAVAARVVTDRQMDRHTHTHTKYCNPAAQAQWVNKGSKRASEDKWSTEREDDWMQNSTASKIHTNQSFMTSSSSLVSRRLSPKSLKPALIRTPRKISL